jgi:hypothetical protein
MICVSDWGAIAEIAAQDCDVHGTGENLHRFVEKFFTMHARGG